MNYVRERPLWDQAVYPRSTKEIAQYDTVIFNKNEEWRYESELRQLFLLHGLKRKPLANGRTAYFLPIPPEIIVSVPSRNGLRRQHYRKDRRGVEKSIPVACRYSNELSRMTESSNDDAGFPMSQLFCDDSLPTRGNEMARFWRVGPTRQRLRAATTRLES